jgi:hypothetical protein
MSTTHDDKVVSARVRGKDMVKPKVITHKGEELT